MWLHADADIRLARRIRRDTVDRGRDVTSVLGQVFKHCILLTNLCYLQTLQISLRYHACNKYKYDTNTSFHWNNQYVRFVKPAFDAFVLPSKKYADVIIPKGGDNHVAIDLIVQHIHTKLGQHNLCKVYPNVFVVHTTFQVPLTLSFTLQWS